MKTKTVWQAGILAASVAATGAQAELSANIGVTSNYLWRGVTQSDDTAAVSGGIDFEHTSGFYAGAWASSIDWGTTETLTDSGGDTVDVPVDDGSYELDLYGGWGGSIGEFGYGVGFTYSAYPELDDSDFLEINAEASWQMLSAGVAYTVDGDAEEPAPWVEGDVYYWGSVGFELQDDWSLAFTVGYYDFDYDGDPAVGDVSYSHYQADLSKSAGEMGDFTLTLSEAEEESGDDETKVVVSWAKSF